MTDDLIKRLDALDNCANWQGANRHIGPIAREAKRALEAAKRDNERLREALGKIAFPTYHPRPRGQLDCQIARAALSGERQEGEGPK